MSQLIDSIKKAAVDLELQGLEILRKFIDRGDSTIVKSVMKVEPEFQYEYQSWYSKALRLIEQTMPGRYDEFVDLYRVKARKHYSFSNYAIYDHFLRILPNNMDEQTCKSAVISRFFNQLAIIKSLNSSIDSILYDVSGTIAARLSDSELVVCRELLKARQPRAAGAVAGVLLERHLSMLVTSRDIPIKRKHYSISEYNDLLKDAGILDVPTWRMIQHLADIRNYCVHQKEREPTRDEVTSLIDGVDRFLKTVF